MNRLTALAIAGGILVTGVADYIVRESQARKPSLCEPGRNLCNMTKSELADMFGPAKPLTPTETRFVREMDKALGYSGTHQSELELVREMCDLFDACGNVLSRLRELRDEQGGVLSSRGADVLEEGINVVCPRHTLEMEAMV